MSFHLKIIVAKISHIIDAVVDVIIVTKEVVFIMTIGSRLQLDSSG